MRVKFSDEGPHDAEVRVVSGRDLDSTLVRAWRDIHFANPELSSPYFAPEFTQIISDVRDRVEIGVISSAAGTVGFFPFHRELANPAHGTPVAASLTDWQGLVCSQNFRCDPGELIRECGLTWYEFHRFLGSQQIFAPFHKIRELSAQIDLSGGFDAYAEEKRSAGSNLIKGCANLARRMEREIGPLRFVAHCQDSKLLRNVLALKSAQYQRTKNADIFAIEWVRNAVERIHATQTPEFAGTLSLLYAGDRLVAGHFGMRSRTTWHYWFPAYEREMAKYSPGLNLFLRMAAYAPSAGLSTIELGRLGRNLYKRRLINRGVVSAVGGVDCAKAFNEEEDKVSAPIALSGWTTW